MKVATHAVVAPRQKAQAKALRTKMTEPERKLWCALRQRLPVEGSHFRRQVPIAGYIVDFCCLDRKLVIEVDGNQHGIDKALAFDAKRTALIESHGFRVLRFSNFDVMRSLDSVLDTIFAALDGTPTPAPGLNTHKGEGGALAVAPTHPERYSPPHPGRACARPGAGSCGEGQGVGVADEGSALRRGAGRP